MTRVSMNPWNPVYSTHDMIRRNVPISESIRVVVEIILTKGIDSWQEPEWSLQTSEEDGCSNGVPQLRYIVKSWRIQLIL